MNKTLKWILIGLAVAAGTFIIALPILMLAQNSGRMVMMDGWGLRDGLRDGLRTTYHHSPFFMMPLMGIFGLLRLLLPVAVLGLAVYGVVALLRGNRAVQKPPVLPTQTPVEARVCSACGHELHREGEFCHFCGARQ
jgi:hypothetical protein